MRRCCRSSATTAWVVGLVRRDRAFQSNFVVPSAPPAPARNTTFVKLCQTISALEEAADAPKVAMLDESLALTTLRVVRGDAADHSSAIEGKVASCWAQLRDAVQVAKHERDAASENASHVDLPPASKPALLLVHVSGAASSAKISLYCPRRAAVVYEAQLAAVKNDPDTRWAAATAVTVATDGALHVALIDCSAVNCDASRQDVQSFCRALSSAGIDVWSTDLTGVALCFLRKAAEKPHIMDGSKLLTSVHPALREQRDPWVKGASAAAVCSRGHTLLLAACGARTPLAQLSRGRTATQQIADLVAPLFPTYIITVRRQQRVQFMALMDIHSKRSFEARGETEDLLRLLIELTMSGPIGLVFGLCDHQLLFSLTSALLRAQRLAIVVQTGKINRCLIGAAPSYNPDVMMRNLVAALAHAKPSETPSSADGSDVSIAIPPKSAEAEFIRQTVEAVAVALRAFVGDTRGKSDVSAVLASVTEQSAAPGPTSGTSDEAQMTAAATGNLSPVQDWLFSVYKSPARVEAERAALCDLVNYVAVAYTRTDFTFYQRPGNPTAPGNCVTMLACHDGAATLLPLQRGVRRGDTALPPLDGYSVLVAHHAKDFLLLMSGDVELQRFLKRGGRVWCISIAEFVLSAFRAKSPETTLSVIAAVYGAAPVADDTPFEPPRASMPGPRSPPQLRAATNQERGQLGVAVRAVAGSFEGQKNRAVAQMQLVSLRLRLESLLAFVELERNGLKVREDLVTQQQSAHVGSLADFDRKLQAFIPAALPDQTKREWSWQSHGNLKLYFFGGTVRIVKTRSNGAAESSSAKPETGADFAHRHCDLFVRLAHAGRGLAKMGHHPALRRFCAKHRLTKQDATSTELVRAATDYFSAGKGARATANARVVLFDLETTGLDPTTDRIVEICFFDPLSEKKFSTLIDPQIPIPPSVSMIHQITDDMVVNAPRFADVAKPLCDFLTSAGGDESVVLLSHNSAMLDAPLLQRELDAAGFGKVARERFVFCDSIPILKAAREQRKAQKQRRDIALQSLRLSELRRRFDIQPPAELDSAHRATADTLVLWEVLAHVLDAHHLNSNARMDKLLQVIGGNIAVTSEHCFARCNAHAGTAGSARDFDVITVRGEVQELFKEEKDAQRIVDTLRERNWDNSVFEDLARAGSPVASLLQQKLQLERISTAFLTLDPTSQAPAFVHPDGMVRQDVKLTTAITGRTASSVPNCQNIPKSDKSEIRRLFVSRFGPDNGVCVEIDYAQLEVNVMALLCQDRRMIADLERGVDFHIKRCVAITGRDYDELKALHKAGDKDVGKMRQNAKIMSFQRMYGGGVQLLAKTTGLDVDVVKHMIQTEEAEYPAVPQFHRLIRALCFRDDNPGLPTHYVAEMPNGLRVSFNPTDALNNLPPMKNYPVQAYGAELVQAALGVLARKLLANDNYGGRAYLVNFVHDSVWFDAHRDVAQQLIADGSAILSSIRELFETRFPGIASGVSFNVSVSVGKDMYDMQGAEKFFGKK